MFQGRLLLDDAQVVSALNLDLADINWLCSTQQLCPITIRGKRRFLAREIEALLNTYQSTQYRSERERQDN